MCIFAKQLCAVLYRHDRNLGSLFAIRIGNTGDRKIHPQQIMRLKQAANGDCSISVTLNPDELDAVIHAFKLDSDDVRRLRAALTAESFYRFFLDRVDGTRMLELAEQLFHVMLSGDMRSFVIWKDDTLEDVRVLTDDAPEHLSDQDARIAHDLEPAIELYEEAQLWLTAANSARSSSRRVAYTQLVLALLSEAQEVLRYPSGSVESTPQYADWQEIISSAVTAVRAGMHLPS